MIKRDNHMLKKRTEVARAMWKDYLMERRRDLQHSGSVTSVFRVGC